MLFTVILVPTDEEQITNVYEEATSSYTQNVLHPLMDTEMLW